jgi:hypothetical protein
VEQYQEALHIGLGLKEGGEQPVGGVTGCQERRKIVFLFLRIQKINEDITKEI